MSAPVQAGSSSSSLRALVLTKDHLAIYPGAAAAVLAATLENAK